jgi:hypothetical protein
VQSTVEALRSTGTLAASTTMLNDPQFPQGRLTVAVGVYDATLRLQRLTVTVTWQGNGTQNEGVSLDTLVGSHAKHPGG